ncbi:MAG: MbcA/ParS/Xre antitoxin family protein [Pseudomonadota bacterium]
MEPETSGKLIVRAVEVFRDVDDAARWLKSPNRLLDGKTPLEAQSSALGAARAEKQLNWFAGKASGRH